MVLGPFSLTLVILGSRHRFGLVRHPEGRAEFWFLFGGSAISRQGRASAFGYAGVAVQDVGIAFWRRGDPPLPGEWEQTCRNNV
jgi:hypothetical protein